MTIYQEKGYKDRDHYLRSFAKENGIKYSEVKTLADMLGPNEDFDGLVNEVEDYLDFCEEG
jgi:hypothetical protein